jgi:hypothetical protein
MFNDLNDMGSWRGIRQERQRQAEESRASVNKDQAPKRRRVGTGSQVGLAGSADLLSDPPLALPKTGSTKRELQRFIYTFGLLLAKPDGDDYWRCGK